MNETDAPSLVSILPEIVLAIGAMALLMLGAFRGEHTARIINWLSIVLLVVVAIVVLRLPPGKLVTFGGSFVVDSFARFLKLLALSGSAAAIFISLNFLKVEKQEKFEYSILILLSTT